MSAPLTAAGKAARKAWLELSRDLRAGEAEPLTAVEARARLEQRAELVDDARLKRVRRYFAPPGAYMAELDDAVQAATDTFPA